jgi:hypothetical protein
MYMATKHPETTVIDLRKLAAEKKPRGRPRNTWITGSDPVTHAQYVAWAKARAQAHYRKEVWEISFDDWQKIWLGNWHKRGRGSSNLCMIRSDTKQPWSIHNVELMLRRKHCQIHANYK